MKTKVRQKIWNIHSSYQFSMLISNITLVLI
jgi:hypothetical protein